MAELVSTRNRTRTTSTFLMMTIMMVTLTSTREEMKIMSSRGDREVVVERARGGVAVVPRGARQVIVLVAASEVGMLVLEVGMLTGCFLGKRGCDGVSKHCWKVPVVSVVGLLGAVLLPAALDAGVAAVAAVLPGTEP